MYALRRFLIVVLLSAAASAQSLPQSRTEPAPEDPPVLPPVIGRWDATITPDPAAGGTKYEVPFQMVVEVQGRGLRGFLVNGTDRIPFSQTIWNNDRITLRLEQYDGEISAQCDSKRCEHLEGEYRRMTSAGLRRFKVAARRHPVEVTGETLPWTWPSLEGQWTITQVRGPENPDRVAPARFEQKAAMAQHGGGAAAEVNGTIAPVSGDYGLLHGRVWVEKKEDTAASFELSRFDGVHLVLVRGQIQRDGTLVGKLTTGPKSSFDITGAKRAAPAKTGTPEEPNPETVTRVKDPAQPFQFRAIDLRTGKPVTQSDPRFRGKALIVDIFGTWCPNCHDEAPLLSDLHNRYREQGLEIVGLAYEYTPDRARSARLIDLYRKKYNIGFPLLLAGTTDEGQIEKTLPQLVNFSAYPTTVFIDREGKVHAIHSGFAGPATGKYEEVKHRFEELVRQILK